MPDLPLSDDFKSIVLNRTPLIDVRAPVEFANGAFPNAVNLPLMNDEERHLIGIRYKEEGNAAAVKLGHELVSGEIKQSRIRAWSDLMASKPDAMLYCFRGGQRSKISQEWLSESGKEITRLKGGYKAFRNYLIDETERSIGRFKPIVLGGRTGSGKTILLKKLKNAIDLEALANHRGSSFGRKIIPQPTQINFENALAYDLIHKLEEGCKHLVFEDEGKNVGSIYIPKPFAAYLAEAPRVILETSTQERVETTFKEYVVDAQTMYQEAGLDDPLKAWEEDIHNAMDRIMKRIGSERHREVSAIFDNAVHEQKRSGSLEAYKEWAEYLLREYYDPMYDYQIEKRSSQIDFRGSDEEILAYLEKL
jgi:tRNA 2-selenouridine synthase